METIEQIESRRETILKEMKRIRSMKRGTINEQYFKVRVKGKEEPVIRGPYYVFSRREGKKTTSQRLCTRADLEQARNDIAAHKLFLELCKEFEVLTERLGVLEKTLTGDKEEKKHWKRRSRRIER